jgi:hypothetical protein
MGHSIGLSMELGDSTFRTPAYGLVIGLAVRAIMEYIRILLYV